MEFFRHRFATQAEARAFLTGVLVCDDDSHGVIGIIPDGGEYVAVFVNYESVRPNEEEVTEVWEEGGCIDEAFKQVYPNTILEWDK